PFYVPCGPDKQTNLRSKDLLSFCSNGGVEVGIQLLVGVLIGKAGSTIRTLQNSSGARIQIIRDAEADPHSASNQVKSGSIVLVSVWHSSTKVKFGSNKNRGNSYLRDILGDILGKDMHYPFTRFVKPSRVSLVYKRNPTA
ncbi:KH domain-containing protein, partial [Tanacetum coccineum]